MKPAIGIHFDIEAILSQGYVPGDIIEYTSLVANYFKAKMIYTGQHVEIDGKMRSYFLPLDPPDRGFYFIKKGEGTCDELFIKRPGEETVQLTYHASERGGLKLSMSKRGHLEPQEWQDMLSEVQTELAGGTVQ